MQSAHAIVISATPYSETTLIVRLLTSDHGIVRALAKGARRPKSRFHGSFEPFNKIQTMLALRDPEKLGTLGETSVVQSWPWLRSDLERLAYAGAGLETLGRLAEISPVEPFFYEEAERFLKALGPAKGAGSILIALLLRLLHHGGFPPQGLEIFSTESIPATVQFDFQSSTFSASGEFKPHSMQLPGRAVASMAEALENPPPLGEPFRVRAADGAPLLRWLIRVWEDHLAAKLKSAEFLEKMVLSQRLK